MIDGRRGRGTAAVYERLQADAEYWGLNAEAARWYTVRGLYANVQGLTLSIGRLTIREARYRDIGYRRTVLGLTVVAAAVGVNVVIGLCRLLG